METEELKKQIRYFFEHKIPVYIKKNNGRFYKGVILELEGDLLILDDRVLGAMPIYFLEISFVERGRDGEKRIN